VLDESMKCLKEIGQEGLDRVKATEQGMAKEDLEPHVYEFRV
jgi:hypothetical protein